MTTVVASHTGSLTPASNPWTFVGSVTWDSGIDPTRFPDNEEVVLRLAFTTLDLSGATIAFTTSGSGRSATLPSDGPGRLPLLDHQRRDEEPRQGEEQGDARAAAVGEPGRVEMGGDHQEHGDAANPVQSWPMTETFHPHKTDDNGGDR